MIRTSIAAALGLSALALVACNPKPLQHSSFHDMAVGADDSHPMKMISALDCPDREGGLTRTAQAADGKSCDYQGPGDETVHLALVSLDGKSPTDAMAPMKSELKGLVAAPADGPVSVEASKDEGGADRAKIDLPFFHVDAEGDKADVKIFGTTVHANGKNADVHTDMGLKNTTVHAGPGGAEVVAEDVGKVNASLVYVLAGESAGPSGYKAVGYIAKGPKDGPLVAAEFRAKQSHHSNDEHGDIGRLIDRNVRG
jgi:hypothetical protein